MKISKFGPYLLYNKFMNEIIAIQNLIYQIRGYRVMLDSDLANLYETETKRLNKSVKRNIEKFPAHFMFQLTKEEWKILKSQIATFKNELEQYFIQHCKANQNDIKQIYDALNLLMDRTKPNKIGF